MTTGYHKASQKYDEREDSVFKQIFVFFAALRSS